MMKPDWIKAIDEAIEAKQRIYAMNSQDRDRRKMDTVPMTAMRRMNEGAIDYWKQQAFTMAAGQCCVKSGGLMADDHGHQYCDMERQRDEWKRKAEEAARDAANGQKIMRLLASIFYYGNFTAETANERELQAVMESAGWWPFKSEADLFAAIAAKGEA